MSRQIELENLIKKYATSYYSGESEVSDEYFDGLVEELKYIAPDSELLKTGWGYSPSGRKKVHHKYGLHIGSLPKYKTIESIPGRFSGLSTRISAKLDGLSVVSYYENGQRVLCVTRGNGEEGQDITTKMDLICPEGKELPEKFTGAIRGEVVMPMSVWNSKYKELSKDNPSANPRNIASGLLNRDTLTKEESEDLKYVVYKILYSEGNYFKGVVSFHKIVEFLGLSMTTVPRVFLVEPGQERFEQVVKMFRKKYPCDGLVLTREPSVEPSGVFDYDEIAFKFQAKSKVVKVKEVTYSATRTGRMAPLVWLENPVELSGALVKKCTGFNAAFIRDSKIGPGAEIEICRSGEVIPHIMKVVKKSEPELIERCPNCGEFLVWKGDDLVCENESDTQLSYRFITTCADLDGAGPSLYSKIIETQGLTDVDSLAKFLSWIKSAGYEQVAETILKENGDVFSGSVTQFHVETILRRLGEPIDPVYFIAGCNIKGISWSAAQSILDEYPKFFEDIANDKLDAEKLKDIKGVGWKTVETIEKHCDRIKKLYNSTTLAEHITSEELNPEFKVAITGTLSVKRSEFISELNRLGIEVSSNFKEIKYLITNNPDSTSSKMKKARDNGVEVISEEDFRLKYLTDRC